MMCGFTGLLVHSDDTALGLDVLVQGINPIVEYVPLIVLSVSYICLHAITADRRIMILASSQYIGLNGH